MPIYTFPKQDLTLISMCFVMLYQKQFQLNYNGRVEWHLITKFRSWFDKLFVFNQNVTLKTCIKFIISYIHRNIMLYWSLRHIISFDILFLDMQFWICGKYDRNISYFFYSLAHYTLLHSNNSLAHIFSC